MNLGIEIWKREILETNHGVKVVDEDIVKGTGMSNFIQSLDYLYDNVRSKNNISSYNKKFALYIPIKVKIYKRENDYFIVRKGQFTRYLYVKEGCRVYFSDADILMMLLQINDSTTIDLLIEALKNLYFNEGEAYNIVIREKSYELKGIREITNDQMFTNPQDINISFMDLLILINLILAKDMMSVPLWPDKPNFLKHTTSKYILLLLYYYYKDEKAKSFLESIGFDVESDIYSNYDTQEKRNEKLKIFCDFDSFEKSGIV